MRKQLLVTFRCPRWSLIWRQGAKAELRSARSWKSGRTMVDPANYLGLAFSANDGHCWNCLQSQKIWGPQCGPDSSAAHWFRSPSGAGAGLYISYLHAAIMIWTGIHMFFVWPIECEYNESFVHKRLSLFLLWVVAFFVFLRNTFR